jgi:hypothetical protein
MNPMKMAEHLEIKEGICEFRPRGESTLVEAVTHITFAIAYCRQRKIDRLLVDATGFEGIPIPTLVDRFLMVEEWAEVAEGLVVGAMVVHSEYIHPEKFGVQVAADFGLEINVFTSEDDAFEWLAMPRDQRHRVGDGG